MTPDPFDPFEELPVYTDYFLCFDNEDEARMQLYEEEADDTLTPKYAAIDVIGTIYKPTGKTLTTDEGPVDEMTPIDGWHVNVRHTADAPELDQWRVYPQTPARMWF